MRIAPRRFTWKQPAKWVSSMVEDECCDLAWWGGPPRPSLRMTHDIPDRREQPTGGSAADQWVRPTTPWTAFWQSVTRFQKEKVTPWMALRNALGIAIPLF